MFSSLAEALHLKKKFVTKKDVEGLYKRNKPSFADLLPYSGYDDKTGTFILEDGFSRAKVFTINPVATEGRGIKTLIEYRDAMQDFIEQTFDELMPDQGQWVIQQFSYDDPRIENLADQVRAYCKPHARDTEFTQEYIKTLREHLKGISSNKEGIFFDDEVTNAPWIGRYRRTKLVVYRRCTNAQYRKKDFCPAREVNEACEKGLKLLSSVGYQIKEDDAKEFFSWMVRIFNPNPNMDNAEDFYSLYENIIANEVDGELPIASALNEALIANPPRSNTEDNCWYFDEVPSRFIRLAGTRRPPRIGQLTGEVADGVGENQRSECALDKLPPNSIVASTTIICPAYEFEELILNQAEKAYGDGMAAERKQEELIDVKDSLNRRSKVVRHFSGVYIRAKDKHELRQNTNTAITVLHSCGLRPLKDNVDAYALNAYILSLPMFFNPLMDRKRTYHKPTWAQYVANLSLGYGRDEGTGRPNFIWFNRGGSPLTVDPFSKDRASNTFGLMLGAPGSGKSASAVTLLNQIMAVHRPKAFILEKGNSFGLVGDYLERHGVSVGRMTFTPNSKTTLALFSDAMKLLQKDEGELSGLAANVGDIKEIFNESIDDIDDEEEVTRDILGELEMIALLMITGGEKQEYEMYRRPDRQVLRKAIIAAAKLAQERGEICLPEHIRDALKEISKGRGVGEDLRDLRRDKAADMAEALDMWCEKNTFTGNVFNSHGGDPIPDADVVIIDVGAFADDGKEAELAVLVTGIFQYITMIAERDQYKENSSGIAFFIDEAHLLTVNPLLAPFIIKMVKMYRKLGVHPWFITQNITDFPAEAEKLLTMIEWYIVMLASPDEIEKISKYKSLTLDQKNMMSSTKKADKKFTEGVLLGKKIQALFRAVPPSKYLTLAMTEREEKEARAIVMRELKEQGKPHTELDAALEQANRLNVERKIAMAD